MKIYEEKQVRFFEFWSGAKYTAEKIDEADAWDIVEIILDDLFPDGVEDVQLNDLFWFDADMVLGWAGIEEEDDV